MAKSVATGISMQNLARSQALEDDAKWSYIVKHRGEASKYADVDQFLKANMKDRPAEIEVLDKDGNVILDENGNPTKTPVLDADGKPVIVQGYESYRVAYFKSIPSFSRVENSIPILRDLHMSITQKQYAQNAEVAEKTAKAYADLTPAINNLLSSIAPDVAKPVQGSEEFMGKVVDQAITYQQAFSYGVKSSMYEQRLAWENGLRNGIVELDLEGIGGDGIGSAGDIYEFGFMNGEVQTELNADGSFKSIKDPKVTLGAVGALGFSAEQASPYQQLIDQARKYGIAKKSRLAPKFGIDPKNRYILEYLMRIGHDKTKIERKNHITQFTSVAEMEDAKVLNYDTIQRGLDRLKGIYTEQMADQTSIQRGDKIYRMTYEEKAIFDTMFGIKNGSKTLSTHNGLAYDIPQLTARLRKSKTGAAALLRDEFDNDLRTLPNIADFLAVTREVGPSNRMRGKDAAGIFTQGALRGESVNASHTLTASVGAEQVVNETISSLFGGVNIFHTGQKDAATQLVTKLYMATHNEDEKVANSGLVLNPTDKNYVFKNSFANVHRTDMGDIFFVKNGALANQNEGGLSFVWDAGSREFRFAGGIRTDGAGGYAQENVRQTMKAHSAYMLLSSGKFETSEKFQKLAQQAGIQDAQAKNLYFAAFMPMRAGDEKFDVSQQHNIVFKVGSEREIQEYLSQNLDFVGNAKVGAEHALNQKAGATFDSLSLKDQIQYLKDYAKDHFDQADIDTKKATYDKASETYREDSTAVESAAQKKKDLQDKIAQLKKEKATPEKIAAAQAELSATETELDKAKKKQAASKTQQDAASKAYSVASSEQESFYNAIDYYKAIKQNELPLFERAELYLSSGYYKELGDSYIEDLINQYESRNRTEFSALPAEKQADLIGQLNTENHWFSTGGESGDLDEELAELYDQYRAKRPTDISHIPDATFQQIIQDNPSLITPEGEELAANRYAYSRYTPESFWKLSRERKAEYIYNHLNGISEASADAIEEAYNDVYSRPYTNLNTEQQYLVLSNGHGIEDKYVKRAAKKYDETHKTKFQHLKNGDRVKVLLDDSWNDVFTYAKKPIHPFQRRVERYNKKNSPYSASNFGDLSEKEVIEALADPNIDVLRHMDEDTKTKLANQYENEPHYPDKKVIIEEFHALPKDKQLDFLTNGVLDETSSKNIENAYKEIIGEGSKDFGLLSQEQKSRFVNNLLNAPGDAAKNSPALARIRKAIQAKEQENSFWNQTPEEQKRILDEEIKKEESSGVASARFGADGFGRSSGGMYAYSDPTNPNSVLYSVVQEYDKAHKQQTLKFGSQQEAYEFLTNVDNLAYIDQTGVDKAVRDKYRFVGSKNFSAVDAIKEGAHQAESDSAAGMIRHMSYKRAKSIVTFFDKVDQEANRLIGENTKIAKTRMEVADQAIRNLMEAWQKNPRDSKLGDIFNYFFRTDLAGNTANALAGKKVINSNTINNVVRGTALLSSMRDVIQSSVEAVDRIAGGKDKSYIKNAYFTDFFHNTLAEITRTAGLSSVDDLFPHRIAPMTHGRLDLFRINLTPLISGTKEYRPFGAFSNTQTFYDIDLTQSSPHFGRQIARRLGVDDPVRAVRMVGNMLANQDPKTFGALRHYGENRGYSLELEENRLLKALRWARKQNGELYGNPGELKTIDVTQRSEVLDNMDPEKLQKAIQKGTDPSRIPVRDLTADKNTAKRLVNDIYFKDVKNITQENLIQKYGYSAEEAKNAIIQRDTLMDDAANYLEKILDYGVNGRKYNSELSENGVGFAVDMKSGQLFLTGQNGENGMVDITNNMFRGKFDQKTGTFSLSLGGRRLGAIRTLTKELSDGVSGYKLGFSTIIRDHTNQLVQSMRFLNSAKRNDTEIVKLLGYFFSQQEKEISKYSTMNGDYADAKFSSSIVDISRFFRSLGYLDNQGVYEDTQFNSSKTKDILSKLGKNFTGAHLDDVDNVKLDQDDVTTLYGDLKNLLQPFRDPNSKASKALFANEASRKAFSRMIPSFNVIDLKQADNFDTYYVQSSIRGNNPFTDLGADPRHINSVINRSYDLDVAGFKDEYDKILRNRYSIYDENGQERANGPQVGSVKRGSGAEIRGGAVFDSSERIYDGISGKAVKMERAVRAPTLFMNTDTAQRVFDSEITDEVFAQHGITADERSVFYKYLNESGSMMDSRLLALFPKTIEQRSNTDMLASIPELQAQAIADNVEKEMQIRNKTAEVIELAKNGNIVYKSGQQIWADRDSVIANNLSYRNTDSRVHAEREGLLGVGWYDQKKRLTDSDLSEIINRKENKARIEEHMEDYLGVKAGSKEYQEALQTDAKAQAVLRQAVGNVLADNGYRRRAYLADIDALPYRKMLQDTEKTMSEFLMGRLGVGERAEDKRIAGVLDELGVSDKLKGRYIDDQYFRINKSGDMQGLSDVSEAIGGKALTQETLAKAGYTEDYLTKAGYTGEKAAVQAFRDDVYRERTRLWDAGLDVLRRVGILGKNEVVYAIGDTATEAWKRVNPNKIGAAPEAGNIQSAFGQYVRNEANSLMQKNASMTEDEAFGKAQDKLYHTLTLDNGNPLIQTADGKNAVSVDGDHLRLASGYVIQDVNKLQDLLSNNLGINVREAQVGTDANGNPITAKTFTTETTIRAVSDPDEPGLNNGHNRKGMRATRRMLSNMQQEVWGDETIQKTWESYNKRNGQTTAEAIADSERSFLKDFGDIAEFVTDDKGNVLRDASGQAQGVRLKQGVRNTGMNVGLTDYVQQSIIAGTDPADVVFQYGSADASGKAELLSKNGAAIEQMERNGVSSETAREIADSLAKRGYHEVGTNAIYNTYAFSTGRAAAALNYDLHGISTPERQDALVDDFVKKSGFEKVDITDILKVNDQFNQNNPIQANRPMVLDLGADEKLWTRQGSRYIAVPFQAIQTMDDRYGAGVDSRTQLMSDTQTLAYQIQNYRDAGENVSDSLRNRIQDMATQLQEDVLNATHNKTGAAAQATSGYLRYSGRFKSDIIRPDAMKNPILQKAAVNGQSIAERAAAGRETNAIFLGEDFFRNAIETPEMQGLMQNIRGADGKPVTNYIDSMLQDFETQGAAGFGARQPMEYMNSVSATTIFLDRNIGKNTMRLTEAAATAMKADMDGDDVYAHMVMGRAKVTFTDAETGEQRSQIAHLNEVQFNYLDRMAQDENSNIASVKLLETNVAGSGKDLFEHTRRTAEAIAAAPLSGVGIGGRDRAASDEEIATEVLKHDNLSRIQFGDGKAYSAGYFQQRNQNGELDRQYQAIAQSDKFQQAVADYNQANNLSGDMRAVSNDLSMEQFLGNKGWIKYGEDASQKGVAQRYVESLDDPKERAAASEVMAYHGTDLRLGHEVMQTRARTNAGLANHWTYQFKGIQHALISRGEVEENFSTADNEIVTAFTTHINEAFQAGKNNTSVGLAINDYRDAIHDFFGLNQNGVANQTKLNDFIDNIFAAGGMDKEAKRLPTYALDSEGPAYESVGVKFAEKASETEKNNKEIHLTSERVKQALSHMMRPGRSISQDFVGALNVGIGQTFALTDKNGNDNPMPGRTGEDKEILNDVAGASNDFLERRGLEGGMDAVDLTVASGTRGPQLHLSEQNYEEGFDYEDADPSQFRKSLSSSIESAAKHLKSSKGVLGMLGFAGAAMVAGMAGGAPTSPIPADGQAQGIQSENAMYELPSTMPNPSGFGSTNQGYIINVNASTDRGREFATNAINQVFAQNQATSGGVNMSMNIKDSSSNISYRDIASYVTSML